MAPPLNAQQVTARLAGVVQNVRLLTQSIDALNDFRELVRAGIADLSLVDYTAAGYPSLDAGTLQQLLDAIDSLAQQTADARYRVTG
jgi:hypothetical protein